jgi:hypothetical protein
MLPCCTGVGVDSLHRLFFALPFALPPMIRKDAIARLPFASHPTGHFLMIDIRPARRGPASQTAV